MLNQAALCKTFLGLPQTIQAQNQSQIPNPNLKPGRTSSHSGSHSGTQDARSWTRTILEAHLGIAVRSELDICDMDLHASSEQDWDIHLPPTLYSIPELLIFEPKH